LKRGITVAAFQFFGISDDTKERLNRLVIGVATMAVDKESMASRRERLIEILDNRGFISGDSVT
jgi:hypothetical protein